MSEGYISPLGTGQTYILELSERTIRVLAQSLHLYLLNDVEDSSIADTALSELIYQTNIVHREPRDHSVFLDSIMAPGKAKVSTMTYFVPVNR